MAAIGTVGTISRRVTRLPLSTALRARTVVVDAVGAIGQLRRQDAAVLMRKIIVAVAAALRIATVAVTTRSAVFVDVAPAVMVGVARLVLVVCLVDLASFTFLSGLLKTRAEAEVMPPFKNAQRVEKPGPVPRPCRRRNRPLGDAQTQPCADFSGVSASQATNRVRASSSATACVSRDHADRMTPIEAITRSCSSA